MEINKENKRKVLPTRKAFKDFVLDKHFPCIMAQSVFRNNNLKIKDYLKLGDEKTASELLQDIKSYIKDYSFDSNDFYTFIAAFDEPIDMSEREFEKLLWKQLTLIHGIDDVSWDNTVSEIPEDSNFSFSIAGKAFYIVGMHPNSSRKARRSPKPAIVFNLHWQFERLREMGTYQTIRNKIRKRDIKLQGSVNPMLQDFGTNSEARQYSGRAVDGSWKCPFHHK